MPFLPLSAADLFKTGGSLVIQDGVTLRVKAAGSFGFARGDQWTLLDWMSLAGSVSGDASQLVLDLPNLDPWLDWDVSQLFVNGSIIVVPEPSRTLLLALGGSAFLLIRRRPERSSLGASA